MNLAVAGLAGDDEYWERLQAVYEQEAGKDGNILTGTLGAARFLGGLDLTPVYKALGIDDGAVHTLQFGAQFVEPLRFMDPAYYRAKLSVPLQVGLSMATQQDYAGRRYKPLSEIVGTVGATVGEVFSQEDAYSKAISEWLEYEMGSFGEDPAQHFPEKFWTQSMYGEQSGLGLIDALLVPSLEQASESYPAPLQAIAGAVSGEKDFLSSIQAILGLRTANWYGVGQPDDDMYWQ